VFSFDRVFYEESEQADVYQFLALPMVRGTTSEFSLQIYMSIDLSMQIEIFLNLNYSCFLMK